MLARFSAEFLSCIVLDKESYSGVTQKREYRSIDFVLNEFNMEEKIILIIISDNGEFDPGSGRTLAAWIRHASRTLCLHRVANGRVTRG